MIFCIGIPNFELIIVYEKSVDSLGYRFAITFSITSLFLLMVTSMLAPKDISVI